MCGIFAWAGKNPKQFDKTQLNVLGIFNEKRGEHSCGLAVDGEILIGVDKNKVYRDFLARSGYKSPTKLPLVIGHTRHATFGAHTIDNAHPFGFGEHKNYYRFMGVHNGSLLNHTDLAKTYDISTSVEKVSENGLVTKRTKIDSEVLLEIIYKTKNYKVLSEYNGAAALVFTDTKEPNVTYCYHGKSRKTDYLAEPAAIEERPLYYYQESATSLYISSIESSLYAIGGNGDTVEEFEFNTVYKITDGNMKTAEKTPISRVGRFQSGTSYTPRCYENSGSRHHHAPSNNTPPVGNNNSYGRGVGQGQTTMGFGNRPNIDLHSEKGKSLFNYNIYKDAPKNLINSYGNKIYMNKLRYWRNGHLISGIYTWIDTYGFYFLGEDEKSADNAFFNCVNKHFYGTDFVRDPSKLVGIAKEKAFVPFHSTTQNEITEPLKFYMLNGIRLKTSLDYYSCIDLVKAAPGILDWTALSHCSAHPIINIDMSSKRFDQQDIILNNVPFTDKICPLGSEKVYTITNGNCTLIEELDKPSMTVVRDLEDVTKVLKDFEQDKVGKEKTALQVIEAEQNVDRLEDDIEEMFKDSLRRFPGYLKRLSKFKGIQRGVEASEIIETFVASAKKLITVDSKE